MPTIEQCRNCMYHRYEYNGNEHHGLVIAFPINVDFAFSGEICLKDKDMDFNLDNCESFRNWSESGKRKRTKKKKPNKNHVTQCAVAR